MQKTVSTRQLIYNTQQQVMSKQSSSHDHQHVAESGVIIRTTRHETQRTNDEENGRWRQQEETSTSIMDNNCGIQQEGVHALLTSTHTNNKDPAHTTTISVSFDLGSTAGSLLSSSSSKMKLSRKLDSDLEVGGHQCYPDNKSGESCLPAPDDENEERLGVSDILFLSLEGEQSKKSYVPNCCAICIESYQCNQVVVWSPNDDCCHAYHQDCMVEYFLSRTKTEDSKVLCPTCKKCFINITRAVEEEKVLDESIKRPSSGRRNET